MPGRLDVSPMTARSTAPTSHGWRRWRARALSGLAVALVFLGIASAPALAANCPDTYDGRGRVAGLEPGGDLRLADGPVLRLAGLSLAGASGEPALRAALEEIALGRDIEFATAGKDRYGRLVVIVRPAGGAATLQDELLARGVAAARPEKEVLGCMPAWLDHERPARDAGRGIWAELPLDARDIAAIRAREGRFTIVAGRVRSVGNGRRVDYLNFGPVWRQDMTGRLEKPVRIALEARGTTLADLAGRYMAMRGTVLEAGGPAFDIVWTEQIEWSGAVTGTRQAGER